MGIQVIWICKFINTLSLVGRGGLDHLQNLFIPRVLNNHVSNLNLFSHLSQIRNENFSGSDMIRISTRNKNGKNDLDVPVFVEPINDPPFIHVPDSIILKGDEDESLIFNRERDKFEFYIGDPDLLNFPGMV